MAQRQFVKGEIVILPFPYTDFSNSKRRPAVVLGSASPHDFLVCQITSQPARDAYAIPLTGADLRTGRLTLVSYIRPNYLMPVRDSLILASVGHLQPRKLAEVVRAVIAFVQR